MTLREGKITNVNVDEEMRKSYLSYAMSVIVGRAIPEVRDGLKPVHRRLIYAMHVLGLAPNKPHRKSARIVGDTMGKYHPHGELSIYDTLVGLAQDFSTRHPLVDPQGNFGSLDGDAAAAMRYTEARLSKLAAEMLRDIDKDTVGFVPNYDESESEPLVLPTRVPNLLVNGSTGIAVGMASHMAPHNLGEVCRAVAAYIDNPEITVGELLEYIPGPDFPTGGVILGREGIREAYATGRGKLTVRGRAVIEEYKKDRQRIVISEIPYQVNKSRLVTQIAKLINDKNIEGVSDLRDESDRRGLRVVIELKKGAVGQVILNKLYRHTQLQGTFGVINLALVDNEPRYLTLPELIRYFVEHRVDVVERRSRFELDKAQRRAHIVEGLMLALDDIDSIVKLLRASPDTAAAANALITKWSLSEAQAKAILEMRLSRLVALEREKLADEYQKLREQIAYLEELLGDRGKVLEVIREETAEVAAAHADERRTAIVEDEGEIDITDLIADESTVVAITHQGYIKRLPPDTYRAQGRGGRGVTGFSTKDEDFVESLFVAQTHDHLLCFTTAGRCYWLKVYRIPEASRVARGTYIANLLQLRDEERITAVVPVRDLEEPERYLVMATARGKVKRTALIDFSNPRRDGIIAVSLASDDRLIGVRLTNGKREILLATSYGRAIRFDEDQVRCMGRNAQGVIGVRLENDDDYVIGMITVDPGASVGHVLTATDKGYGKRTPLGEYSTKNRGGKGLINIRTTPRIGKAVSMRYVADGEELLLISEHGMVIRISAAAVSAQGRNTQGVRLMRLEEGDTLSAVALLAEESVQSADDGDVVKDHEDQD
ncbi:MAG: DNA gyrase subunit A [Candidatus Coatesbacteria bacterium]|nr:DNA gyrase subunit A [Candidatus Coatesbacteria bacterium]